jgi:hypothetical protein
MANRIRTGPAFLMQVLSAGSRQAPYVPKRQPLNMRIRLLVTRREDDRTVIGDGDGVLGVCSTRAIG